MSGGFFRGTTADQDTRFSNKHAKLLKSQKFPPELENLVDMTKVKMDVMRPWIAHRVTELLGFEDEVLINFIYGLLEEKVVNGKEIQISLTGFMEKNTGKFMKELWTHLLSAQQNASGVPQQFLDAKEEETRKKQEDTDRITRELKKTKEKDGREQDQERVKMDREADDMDAAILEARPRRHTKFSSKWSVDGEGTDERNGSKETARCTRSRSISKSSHSRSHSRSRNSSASPKPLRRSVSLERRSRSLSRRSSTPRRVGSRLHSPSLSPSRGRSPSPARRRLRSPARRRSRSPMWHRSRSPVRRRSQSPLRQRPRSPVRQRPRSPIHQRSRTPIRRRSRSPIRRRSMSRSPIRRRLMSRSPIRRRSMSRSPIRRRLRTPIQRRSRSRSPIWRRSRSRTPIRRRSRPRSPMRRVSRSPIRRRSPFLSQRRARSPYRHRSKSAASSSIVHSRSPSPIRGRSPSPPMRRRYQRAPSTPRHQSPSPGRRTTFLSRHRSPNPESRSSSPSDGISMPPIRGTPPSLLRRRSPEHQQISPIQSSRDRHRDHQAPLKAVAERRRSPTPVRSKSPLSYVSPPVAGRSPKSKSPIPSKREREGTITKGRFDNVEEVTFSREKDDIRENKDPVSDKRDKNSQVLQVEKRNSMNDGMRNKADETNQEAVKLPKLLPKEEKHNQRGSLDSASEESDHKRKHKRKDITSDDDNSHDSHTKNRKEAKRRRKEEKKLKKEEKRKRREERRRKKDARRAEKLKLKARGNVSPSSDSDKSRDTRDESALSDQKKLEIELREKALESLRAKKGGVR